MHEQHQIADAGADAAGQRQQHEAAQLAATVSCPGTDTAAVARSQAATRAAMVLSDLLTRADARAGELAKEVDRVRIAGQQCEREYDALVAKRTAVSSREEIRRLHAKRAATGDASTSLLTAEPADHTCKPSQGSRSVHKARRA